MPEMWFVARWPDGSVETYYSPSLVVREYLEPGVSYPPSDFLSRARAALQIASERVRVTYGYPCSRAAATLARIEDKARTFNDGAGAAVAVVKHESKGSPV